MRRLFGREKLRVPEETVPEKTEEKTKEELEKEGKPLWEEEIKFKENNLEDFAEWRKRWTIIGDFEGRHFVNLAGMETIINPDAKIEKLTDGELHRLRDVASDHWKKYETMWGGSVSPLCEALANAKILGIDVDPDKSIEERMRGGVKYEIAKVITKKTGVLEHALFLASHYKIATSKKDIGIDKDDWKLIKRLYKSKEEKYLVGEPQKKNEEEVEDRFRLSKGATLACFLANMRILNPKINFDSLCSEEARIKIKEDVEIELERLGRSIDDKNKTGRIENAYNYGEVARAAKILSAKKVEVPPEGGLKVE